MATCAICGGEFESDYARAKYCSDSCRAEGARRRYEARKARMRLDEVRREEARRAKIERIRKAALERSARLAEKRAKEEALRASRKAAAAVRIAMRERRRREALENARPAVAPEEPTPGPEAEIPAIGGPPIGEPATAGAPKGSPKFGPPRDLVCAVCGKVFQSIFPHARYCSAACKARRRHVDVIGRPAFRKPEPPKETRTCAVCGKEFRTRSKVALFCSEECRERGRREAGRPEETYRKVCAECGREFETERATRTRCYECSNKDKKARFVHETSHRCVDCGRRTPDHRCPSCLARWRRKHGVNVTDVWDG